MKPIPQKFIADAEALQEHGIAHNAFLSLGYKNAWVAGDRVLNDKAVKYFLSSGRVIKEYRGSAIGYIVWREDEPEDRVG